MMWHAFGWAQWLTAVSLIVGGLGRLLKRVWPTMPALLLLGFVVGSAYLIVFVDLYLDATDPPLHDLQYAGWAVVFGMAAIGGHEFLKKLGEKTIGVQATEVMLGKLESKLPSPQKKPVPAKQVP